MSVIVGFTIPADRFTLGKVLTGSSSMRITLERVVPTRSELLPFFWAEGDEPEDFTAFERAVRKHPMVEELTVLDRLADSCLYRATWKTEPESLVEGIVQAEGSILSARGQGDDWSFQIRFADHADLTKFQNFLTEHDIPIHVERIATMSESERGSYTFDLTDDQRAALVFAVSEGYFEVPRGVDLTDVADQLGISRQAASERVRRGADAVLKAVLLEA